MTKGRQRKCVNGGFFSAGFFRDGLPGAIAVKVRFCSQEVKDRRRIKGTIRYLHDTHTLVGSMPVRRYTIAIVPFAGKV